MACGKPLSKSFSSIFLIVFIEHLIRELEYCIKVTAVY